MEQNRSSRSAAARMLPIHGWLGLALVALFWPLNWMLDGMRTHWGFFPLWLGFGLTVDGINLRRTGTSLIHRSPRMYAGLFLISMPLWWLFEAINLRTANWAYLGRDQFTDLEYAFFASLSFSTVVPAVLGSAELVAGSKFAQRFRHCRAIPADGRIAAALLATGLAMFGLLMIWPLYFFPFVWLSLFFVVEPVNLRLGYGSLLREAGRGDWRPFFALSLGVMICGFFWEMWNVVSYPKWIYHVPWLGFWHVFEMPLAGYLGYPPFSLELFAMVHLMFGLAGLGRTRYVTAGLAPD